MAVNKSSPPLLLLDEAPFVLRTQSYGESITAKQKQPCRCTGGEGGVSRGKEATEQLTYEQHFPSSRPPAPFSSLSKSLFLFMSALLSITMTHLQNPQTPMSLQQPFPAHRPLSIYCPVHQLRHLNNTHVVLRSHLYCTCWWAPAPR